MAHPCQIPMAHNRNPKGNNQHGQTAKLDDPGVEEALREYHSQRITSNVEIADLMTKRGFKMSDSTVKRFRSALNLTGSRAIHKTHSPQQLEQMIVNQVDTDLAGNHGVRTIVAKLAYDQQIHVPRDLVSEVMHLYYPDGFDGRAPGGTSIRRSEKNPLGPHERWCGDGHDKMIDCDCPIYSFVDDATGKRLGAWVVPNNREGQIVAYLFLTLVLKYQGIPLQTSTDCGSETTVMYSYQTALMEAFHPDVSDVVAHSYVRSVHNIAVERSWRTLQKDWGQSASKAYKAGIDDGLYDPDDPQQRELARWLWAGIFQRGLDRATDFRNGAPMRKDKKKNGPNGKTRNINFDHPEQWGGTSRLLPVDPRVVSALRERVGDESLLRFGTVEFVERAEQALAQLGIDQVNEANGWYVFQDLYNILYP